METCAKCGKKFEPKHHRQIYCNDPCNSNTARGKVARLVYWYITTSRALFKQMYRSNPKEALELTKRMEREEGPEFVNMVLDGMTETDEFKQLLKVYKKYQK